VSRQLVVIGAGQGGLSAAIHARLLGWDVLVLEQGDRAGGKAASVQLGGYRLDPGPSIIIMPQIYAAVFESAGRKMDDYLRFDPLEPINRTFFDRREPYDLPSGIERATEFIREIEPSDAESFQILMTRLEPVAKMVDDTVFRGPIEGWLGFLNPKFLRMGMAMGLKDSYRNAIDGWFRSPLLRSFFYGFPSYSGQTYDSKAAGALLIPYYMISGGVYYPQGGVSAIPNAFERLARELGVEFRFGERVHTVHRSGDQMTAVETDSGRIDADAFIANVDPETFGALLGRPKPKRPSYSYFTVHWGVPHALPEVVHHTLLVPPGFERGFEELYNERQFPTEPIVYLNNTSATDASVAPEGRTNLFAVVTCPADETQLEWESRLNEYVSRVRRTVDCFGVDLGQPEFERVQAPPYFARKHGNGRGSLYGPDEKERFLAGMLPPPNGDAELRNLAYCGGAVQPGAGLPMVTLGGRFAAERIQRMVR